MTKIEISATEQGHEDAEKTIADYDGTAASYVADVRAGRVPSPTDGLVSALTEEGVRKLADATEDEWTDSNRALWLTTYEQSYLNRLEELAAE